MLRPLLDRIDIIITVLHLDYEKQSENEVGELSKTFVLGCRQHVIFRFAASQTLNERLG